MICDDENHAFTEKCEAPAFRSLKMSFRISYKASDLLQLYCITWATRRGTGTDLGIVGVYFTDFLSMYGTIQECSR
jgi:hypothetical protein